MTGAPAVTDAGAPRDPADPGRIRCDRPCIGCGQNLVGTPIRREPTTGLLHVLCPECGRAAGVQEYPMLGIWGRRLGRIIAGVVVILLLALLGVSTIPMVASATGVHAFCGTRFAEWLDRQGTDRASRDAAEFRIWRRSAENRPHYDALGRPGPFSPGVPVEAWFPPDAIVPILFSTLGAALIGLLWSACLAQRGVRTVLIVCAVITGLSALFLSAQWLSVIARSSAPDATLRSIGERAVLPASLPIGFLPPLLALTGAALLGLPVVRFVIRSLLPPRLSAPLLDLWEDTTGRRR